MFMMERMFDTAIGADYNINNRIKNENVKLSTFVDINSQPIIDFMTPFNKFL